MRQNCLSSPSARRVSVFVARCLPSSTKQLASVRNLVKAVIRYRAPRHERECSPGLMSFSASRRSKTAQEAQDGLRGPQEGTETAQETPRRPKRPPRRPKRPPSTPQEGPQLGEHEPTTRAHQPKRPPGKLQEACNRPPTLQNAKWPKKLPRDTQGRQNSNSAKAWWWDWPQAIRGHGTEGETWV